MFGKVKLWILIALEFSDLISLKSWLKLGFNLDFVEKLWNPIAVYILALT